MNPIKSKRIPFAKISERAKEIRDKYNKPKDLVPVPVEHIIEAKLGISIIPAFGLLEETDIEVLFLSDLKTIYIDSAVYGNKNYDKRNRFTLAHELGHFFLHVNEITKYKFKSAEDWLNFRLNINVQDLEWIERQADEFAGSFLVPSDVLETQIFKNKTNIKSFFEKSAKKYDAEELDELLLEGISRLFSDYFMVSMPAIRTRIKKEYNWPDLKEELLK